MQPCQGRYNPGVDSDAPQPLPAMTPSELARAARVHIESRFNEVRVTGELSNFRRPSSGHWYFSIKDESAQIRCAMFVNRNRFANLQPKDGLAVLLRGRVSLYEARGDFQIIVDHMEAAGEGALRLAYEALLKQLHSEGLTDPARKRPLPAYPKRIAVITSQTGAALQDMLSVWRRRYPVVEVVVLDVAVQGDQSEAQVLDAIARLPEVQADLAIITRGGGSLEDLWTFNMERVARALAAAPIPTISAIGHEIDTAITDYVADVRAPTPSAAAELCTPDVQTMSARLNETQALLARLTGHRFSQLRARLDNTRARLTSPAGRVQQWMQRMDDLAMRAGRAMAQHLSRQRQTLSGLERGLSAQHPERAIRRLSEALGGLDARAARAIQSAISVRQQQAAALARTLHAVSPLDTLGRGYAILTDTAGNAKTSIHTLEDEVLAHLSDGYATLEVKQRHPGEGLGAARKEESS